MSLTSYQECRRCDWDYMQEMSFVRRQPWTDDDSGMMFQNCRRCGKVSIQHFGEEGSVNGVWILHPDSEVLFRVGTAPTHVLEYVFSEDFLKNRGITRALFRGYLRSMLDLSGAANSLVDRAKKSTTLEWAELSMELFRDVLAEYVIRRTRGEEDRRLAVTTLAPLVDLLHERRPLEGTGATQRIDLRFTILEVLESFLQPSMTASVPASEAGDLEAAIDHLTMVASSTQRLNYLSQGMEEANLIDAFVEAKFMYRVFRRRQARLSRAHAESVWKMMHALNAYYTLGSPLDFATKAYEALRALLEHQLVEVGFLKIGKRDQKGTECNAFRSPQSGKMLLLPLFYPKVAIYATDKADRPVTVHDSWVEALDQM